VTIWQWRHWNRLGLHKVGYTLDTALGHAAFLWRLVMAAVASPLIPVSVTISYLKIHFASRAILKVWCWGGDGHCGSQIVTGEEMQMDCERWQLNCTHLR
jgi:hypothetical protein